MRFAQFCFRFIAKSFGQGDVKRNKNSVVSILKSNTGALKLCYSFEIYAPLIHTV